MNLAGTKNQQYWNNIIVNSSRAIRVKGLDDGVPTYSSYNSFYNGQTFVVRDYEPTAKVYSSLVMWRTSGELVGGGNPDINSIYADPKFLNPGGNYPKDYRLQADSPCRNAGKDRKDIGVWPNGDDGTIIGYAPSPPVDLRIGGN